MNQTPLQLGYRMPAEWEPHAATWFSWPRPEGISFPGRYEAVPPVYVELIREIAAVEKVCINVWDASMERWVVEMLERGGLPMGRIHFHHFPAYEPWCRDHGPIFLVREQQGRRERAIVDWGYNAWGNKYPPYDLDDKVPARVAELRRLPLFSPAMVLEGGSIDVNGAGTLLTTEACLLNENRNPELAKEQIETNLRDFLGITNVLWLGEGIVGDDTDGHVDDISRFINARTIVTVVEEDPADENYPILQENLNRLRGMKDQDGQAFRIVQLPMPHRIELEGQRLPASYANFYFANGKLLVPTYRSPNDKRALEILQRELPDRKVIGIDSTDLIWGLGSFHCISQQEPV